MQMGSRLPPSKLAFCLAPVLWLACTGKGLPRSPTPLFVASAVTSRRGLRSSSKALMASISQSPREGLDLHSRAAENFDLSKHILHTDSQIIVVDKPSGFLCVPGVYVKDSLASRVAKEFQIPDMARSVVHRLDQSTSGVVVFARNEDSLKKLHKQFADRLTRKGYLALVEGVVSEDMGEVDLPIRKDLENPPKQVVDVKLGKPCLTKWKVAERGSNRTLVHLVPLTGRTHQLRVHMMAMGHPILGDELYAPEAARAASPRLCLHAQALRFQHPTTMETITFTSSPPFTIDPPSP